MPEPLLRSSRISSLPVRGCGNFFSVTGYVLAIFQFSGDTAACMGVGAARAVKIAGAPSDGHTEFLISKSSFLDGCQCKKLFWTKFHAPDLIPQPDAETQERLDQGRRVGLLARHLFPGGIEVASVEPVAVTKNLLGLGRPLFEPAFSSDGCFSRGDIFVPAQGGWNLVEVKSSTKVKADHLTDLAFQSHVSTGAGLRVRNCFLCHVNPKYVRHGKINPQQLFEMEDVTTQVLALVGEVNNSITELDEILHSDRCPDVEIGPQCDKPHPCPLREQCWSFLPRHHVLTLYRARGKAFKLLTNGIMDLTNVSRILLLTPKQKIQLQSVVTGKPHVNAAAISKFLGRLQYPISFLDFETFATAIPLFDGIRPHQQVPFQFSLHVIRSPGQEPEHFSFLADGKNDPRPEFMERLRTVLPISGSVVAYNAEFELNRLKECATALPEYGDWVDDVEKRTVDLLQPFRSFHFYHPQQRGSCSIKDVLPAVTGSGYEHLEIQNGTAASREFLRITFGGVSDQEKAILRNWLERYCELDTLGMVEIVERLLQTDACGRWK